MIKKIIWKKVKNIKKLKLSKKICQKENISEREKEKNWRKQVCHSSILINRINNVHCKVLSMVYCGKKASFKDLLQKYKALSIHIKHSHYLAVEIDRVKKYYVPNINE